MEEEDYELMPHKDISSLKKHLETVKQNPELASDELKGSIEKLTESLENMLVVFEQAAEEMKLEDKETEVISSKIEPLMNKLDEVIDQNKQIAKGIVAVADMIKELKLKVPRETPKPIRAAPVFKRPEAPVQPTHPEASMPKPAPMPPPGPIPQGAPMPPPGPMPAPPSGPAFEEPKTMGPPPVPKEEHKKRFMDMFKK